jgi:hypothetical protein
MAMGEMADGDGGWRWRMAASRGTGGKTRLMGPHGAAWGMGLAWVRMGGLACGAAWGCHVACGMGPHGAGMGLGMGPVQKIAQG